MSIPDAIGMAAAAALVAVVLVEIGKVIAREIREDAKSPRTTPWQKQMQVWADNVRQSVLVAADQAVQRKIDVAWNQGWQRNHDQFDTRVRALEGRAKAEEKEIDALAILWLRAQRRQGAKRRAPPTETELAALPIFEGIIERQTLVGAVKSKLGDALRKAEGV